MSEAPERIWAFAPDVFDNCSIWQDVPSPYGDAIEYVRADRIEALEAKLAKVVEALTQIERTYYQEATNPSPETVRRMAARMNGIARDTQDALAELTGESRE